jgi:outer membrane receptor protein involved in Fe transport
MRVIFALLLVCAFIVTEQNFAFSQANGSISGVVTDPSGAPVAGAEITLRNKVSGATAKTNTDSAGHYRFQSLAASQYVVQARAPDFQAPAQEIEVRAGTAANLDFHLALSKVEQKIQVNAAAAYSRTLTDLPLSATVVPREEVLDSPGRSVEESLRYVAGVNLQRDNSDVIFPLVPSIAMRGIGAGDTATRSLVLMDQLPLNGGFFGTVFWNRVPKYSVEQIEVVRGASSSLFGSFAEGGVVNVITHVPEKREFTLDATYGQNDRFQGTAQYGDSVLDGKLAYSLTANYYQTRGYFQYPEDQLRPIDERIGADMTALQGRFDFKFSDTVKAFFRAGNDNQNRDGGIRLEKTNVDVPDAGGGLVFDLKDNGLVDVRGFYAHEDFRVDNVRETDDDNTFVSNRHHTNSNLFGFASQWSKPLKGVFSHFTAGADYRRVDGQNNQDVFNDPDVLDSIIVGGGTQTSVGVFGEISVRPADRIEILASLRFDHFSETDGRIVTDDVPDMFPDRTFDVASPRVSMRYQFSQPVALRASYYQGFRAPTLAERYRSFETPTFRGLSNPDLKEEHLRGGEAGIDISAGRFSGQINFFYNHLSEFVGSAEVGDVGGKFTVINANIGAIRSQGVEFTGNLRLHRRLVLLADYTYTDAKVIEGELTGNDVEGAPRHVASLGLHCSGLRGESFDIRGRWVDKTFQDISNEGVMGDHFVLDMFGSYPVHRHVDLVLAAENLLNRQYVADGFAQTLGAPRQISGGIRLHF